MALVDLDAIRARHTSENWQCCKDVAALVAENRRLQDEQSDCADILDRQSAILTGVANALNGPPPELTTWSHHDLAEKAAAVVAVAVEAAARAYYETHDCSPETPWGQLSNGDRAWWADRVRPILTAAAPLIAAQATAKLRSELESERQISADYHEEILAAHAERDTYRAGVAALRDEWRAEAATAERNARALDAQRMPDSAQTERDYATTLRRHANALAALLGGAK